MASDSYLQLTKFSVAVWFKTTKDHSSSAFIVNKGGAGSDTKGKNETGIRDRYGFGFYYNRIYRNNHYGRGHYALINNNLRG